jgi:2-C-methyl-D-erythritol 4-phosphate cytidylyltransferase
MGELSVIITAGGIGKRMGGNYPKQFRTIDGLPILMHTMNVFYKFAPQAQIIVTLPAEWKSVWKQLLLDHNYKIAHEVVEGGAERFHSVKNAIAKCSGEKIMIHDGVRPLVSQETLRLGYKALDDYLGAIPVLEMIDSLRIVEEDKNKAVNRNLFRAVQTPQCFRREELVKAYEVEFNNQFTDDASVFESAGYSIHLFPGNEENLKITKEKDLLLTEFWWLQQKGNS